MDQFRPPGGGQDSTDFSWYFFIISIIREFIRKSKVIAFDLQTESPSLSSPSSLWRFLLNIAGELLDILSAFQNDLL